MLEQPVDQGVGPREEAQLHAAEAEADLARADFERAKTLAQRNVISKAELDNAESKMKQKESTVANMRAMMSFQRGW